MDRAFKKEPSNDIPVTSLSAPSFKRRNDILDYSSSAEHIIYTSYNDGLLRRNSMSFDSVDFCFVCDSSTHEYEITLKAMIDITGMKFQDFADEMIPVYRQIFICPTCFNEVEQKKADGSYKLIKITSHAHSYFA